jgi:malate dehydrogenase (oxaloacetate-decarboxylating)
MKSADSPTPVALTAPNLNRGTAFPHDERHKLRLTGRLPSAVLTLDHQYDHLLHHIDNTVRAYLVRARLCPRESALRRPGVW